MGATSSPLRARSSFRHTFSIASSLHVSYEDDRRGNALAAMLALGRIEIRYHREFSDGRVERLVSTRGWVVTYRWAIGPP